MTINEKILARLNSRSGELVSGGELARELGVTRNGVWKAINQLKKEGYNIDSRSNQGYVLNGNVDILNIEERAYDSFYQLVDSDGFVMDKLKLIFLSDISVEDKIIKGYEYVKNYFKIRRIA